MKGVLLLDLTETMVGGFILRFLVPLAAALAGVHALMTGEITIRGAEVSGLTARLYGAAFLAVGIALTGFPRRSDIESGRVSRATTLRISGGMILFALLMIAATACLFL